MKRLLMTSAFALATATGAFADEASELRMNVANELQTMNVAVDVNKLDTADLSELYLVLTSAEDVTEKERAIMSVVGDDAEVGYEMEDGTRFYMPMNDIRAYVANELDTLGIEQDADSLSDEQVAGLYLALSGSSDDNKLNAANEILQ